jgi:hypothetical protein
MEMVVRMLLMVFGEIGKRYILPAILVIAFISLLSGLVSVLSGGHFGSASLYAAIICAVIALIVSIIASFTIVFGRW